MPTDPTRTLSEWLAEIANGIEACLRSQTVDHLSGDDPAKLREAARLCERFEQPEIAELWRGAAGLEENAPFNPLGQEDMMYWAADLRGYARALVELAEAREKLGRVEGLLPRLNDWNCGHGYDECSCGEAAQNIADLLTAALSGAGGESEVTG